MGYPCANFSLPRPLCSRLRPDVRDRQTDVRHAASLNASALWGGGIVIAGFRSYVAFSKLSITEYGMFGGRAFVVADPAAWNRSAVAVLRSQLSVLGQFQDGAEDIFLHS